MARRPARSRPVASAAACLAIALVVSACAARPAAEPADRGPLPLPEGPMPTLDATVWVQTSAGYEAAALQTYRLARHELDRALADSSRTALLEPDDGYRSRPPAVILDVDETVLDNSPYQARLVRSGREFTPETWGAWVREEAAEPVPGALAFTRAAAERGVAVFYVTNRDHRLEPATRANLRSLGFPLPESPDRLLMQDEREGWGSDKASRRAQVARDHRVLLLLGDDFNDFVSGARASTEAYHRLRERHADRLGRDWFMLPNPTYGTWERAARGFRSGLSPREALRAKLESLDPGR